MAEKVVLDFATGAVTRAPLTPAEEADRLVREAASAARCAIEDRRQAFIEDLRPDAALLQKVKDGTAPTNLELVHLVYWLVARELISEIVT